MPLVYQSNPFHLSYSPILSYSQEAPNWRTAAIARAGHAAIYVEDQAGRAVMTHQVYTPMVPASTLKVATSYCALHTFPTGFRFPTAFYAQPDGTLYVKGYGDPSLISEELARIAKQLRTRGLRTVARIILDDSVFAPDIVIDGRSRSLNPYDAHNSALLVNYNTLHVRVRGGRVESAEPQTPTTALTAQLARGLPAGRHRINLARTPESALLYAGHLLAAFLQQEGIAVTTDITRGVAPANLRPLYVHHSSRSLEDNVRDLLEFSNNLIANQIFLAMGAHAFGAPATVDKGVRVLNDCLQRELGWRDFAVTEGSGLSRHNRVTAAQMMTLLRKFQQYAHLMPVKEQFRAKTGTLNGVSSFAGYFRTPDHRDYRFVIMINDPKTSYEAKFQIARMLYNGLANR